MAECGTKGDTVSQLRSHATQAETHRRLGRWEDSCLHSNEHIRLSRELGDKNEECKALYSLGTVFHTKGKRASMGCKGKQQQQQQQQHSIISFVEHQGTVEISSSYPKLVLTGVTKY